MTFCSYERNLLDASVFLMIYGGISRCRGKWSFVEIEWRRIKFKEFQMKRFSWQRRTLKANREINSEISEVRRKHGNNQKTKRFDFWINGKFLYWVEILFEDWNVIKYQIKQLSLHWSWNFHKILVFHVIFYILP